MFLFSFAYIVLVLSVKLSKIKVYVLEVKTLRWMCSHTELDKIKYNNIF